MCKFATFQSSECEFNIFALDKAKLHSCWQQRARLRGCLYIRPNLKSQAEIAPPRWWLSAVFVKPGPLLQLLSTLAQSRRFTYHRTHILHKMIFVSAACSSRRRYQTMMMIKWGKCAWRTQIVTAQCNTAANKTGNEWKIRNLWIDHTGVKQAFYLKFTLMLLFGSNVTGAHSF